MLEPVISTRSTFLTGAGVGGVLWAQPEAKRSARLSVGRQNWQLNNGFLFSRYAAGASGPTVGFALATGVSVATYSFFGGPGVRAAGTVLGFQACLEVITGLGMVGYALVTRRAQFPAYVRRHGAVGLLAGVISVLGFPAFLLVARSLPLGPVVALRETSVIFGAGGGWDCASRPAAMR